MFPPCQWGTHGTQTLLAAERFSGALFRSLKLGLKIMALWTCPPLHRKPGAEARAPAALGLLLLPQACPPSFALGRLRGGARLWLGQQGRLEGSCVTPNSAGLEPWGPRPPICTPRLRHLLFWLYLGGRQALNSSVAHFKLR